MKFRNASSHDFILAFVERLYWRCMRAWRIESIWNRRFLYFFSFLLGCLRLSILFPFSFSLVTFFHGFLAVGIGKRNPYISYHTLIYRLDRGPGGFSGPLDTRRFGRDMSWSLISQNWDFILFGINRLDTPPRITFQTVKPYKSISCTPVSVLRSVEFACRYAHTHTYIGHASNRQGNSKPSN